MTKEEAQCCINKYAFIDGANNLDHTFHTFKYCNEEIRLQMMKTLDDFYFIDIQFYQHKEGWITMMRATSVEEFETIVKFLDGENIKQ